MRPTRTETRALFLVLAILYVILGLLPVGCARTSIETPDGFRYLGEKNVKIDKMKVQKWHPNGQPAMLLEAEGLSSDPTAVNAGTVEAITGTIGKALDKVPAAPR